jgi:hypothetical protein
MARVLAELRLAFDVFGAPADQADFHRPYLAWNRRITDLIVTGDTDTAEKELATYLFEAERQLLSAHRATEP